MKLQKSLGQHFLHDEQILNKIAQAVQQQRPSAILEVGAGAGALTQIFTKWNNIAIKAVEIDNEKVHLLEKKVSSSSIEIIKGDILTMSPPFDTNFWMIGNFPYYISSQIMFKLLEWKLNVDGVIGMFQKEVAIRISSSHGSKNYGILSILLQSYFKITYLFDVPPNAFTPPPKVMSGVILFKKKMNPFLGDESKLKHLVKSAFNQRRKMLRNSVKHLFKEEDINNPIFEKRPEQLSVSTFHELINHMK